MTFLIKDGIDYQLYQSGSYKLNYRAKFNYINYDEHHYDNFYSVSKIVNNMLKIKEIGPSNGRTLEDSVREIINAVPAQKVCKDYICGKADFITKGIPGEIKTFKEEVDPIYEEKGILQATFYAMLYGTKIAKYVSAIYIEDPNDENFAIIKRIDFYTIILNKLSMKYFHNIHHNIKTPKIEVVA
ncbi:hypothetical protein GFS03_05085 [Sulfolobus sp. E5-1-F]|uniref:hypothetical protein n=1 Tax=Saccharolobus sp. E5-1-F TaxID=2663019 RepID=UPI001294C489|nr:hypothetical protein [Sulfolobus sp. E5-1-F]QGA53993.1 hypothetical protein GFS03_05085 [Sulfolobus sp. E5-1-F]